MKNMCPIYTCNYYKQKKSPLGPESQNKIMKKTVFLKELRLLNFKGVRKLTLDFGQLTNIFGDNGTGKTTVFDAFCWLLFGKDSHDRKDFEVKTLDKNNNPIPKIEHEVNGFLIVDNEEINIRRILKEKWTKKKGSLVPEFTGNVTEYYWNDVPVTQTEYNKKINAIIDEKVFKLITNPFAFDGLKWQDRRQVLIDIVGDVSDQELAGNNQSYLDLLQKLNSNKSLQDYNKQIAASIKKAKDDIKMIPTRIDEVERGKPEVYDFNSLKSELEEKQKELSGIDELLNDANKAFQSKLDGVRKKRIEVNNLKSEIELIENNTRKEAKKRCTPGTTQLDSLRTKLTEKEGELTSFENALKTLKGKQESLKTEIFSIEQRIAKKRDEWNTVNMGTLSFDEKDFCCPTCNRDFEADDIEAKKAELTDKFNTNKSDRLNTINQEGKSLSSEKTNLEKEAQTLKERIASGDHKLSICRSEINNLKEQIESLDQTPENLPDPNQVYSALLDSNTEYGSKLKELNQLQLEITDEPKAENTELITARQGIIYSMDQIKTKLQNEVRIKEADNRIKELEEEEKTLAQKIADVEKEQFTIENFIKHKIDHLESNINKRFKYVKFKMFSEQINGGMSETCEALIDGVPFSSANNASRINAGLDIISTLCEYYNFTAPVFIDNAESVVKLIPIDSQLVRMVVDEDHKELTVEQYSKEELQKA